MLTGAKAQAIMGIESCPSDEIGRGAEVETTGAYWKHKHSETQHTN